MGFNSGFEGLTLKPECIKFLQKAGKIKHQRKNGRPQNTQIFKRKIPTAGNLKYQVIKKVYYLEY